LGEGAAAWPTAAGANTLAEMLDALPKNAVGKIDKPSLRSLAGYPPCCEHEMRADWKPRAREQLQIGRMPPAPEPRRRV
jgi:hypothetical protein